MADIRSSYTESCAFFGAETPRGLAEAFGTPLYVYNEAILRRRCREMKALSSHPGFGVNYSVKANANPVLLRIIREEGLVADAMSPGELHMDGLAGYTRDEILYISNNNDTDELRLAARGSHMVSVDSLAQMDALGRAAPGARVMARVNPGIGAGHHKKVVTAGKETKFGITPDRLDDAFALADRHGLALAGLNQHIGSLFMEPEGYLAAVEVLLDLAAGLPRQRLARLEVLDFGGGFGIPYRKYDGEPRLDLAALGAQLHGRITDWAARTGYAGRFLVEPGRYVAAECGLLLGRVTAVKNNGPRRYAGTDIGFNVLARPMLYDAFHDVEIYAADAAPRPTLAQTIVGNICESGDILAKERELPELREGDVLGVLDAGAYGFAMSSTYNQRLRPAEVLIQADGRARLIRRRETPHDLARGFDGLL